jgi:hypothetical protein
MAVLRRLAAAPSRTRRRFWFGAALAVVGLGVASLALTAGGSSAHRSAASPTANPTSVGAAPAQSPADRALRAALSEMDFASEQIGGDQRELLAHLSSAQDYVRTAQDDLQLDADGGLSGQPVLSSSASDSDLPAILTAVGGLIAALAGLLTAGLSWRRATPPVPAPAS